MSAFSSVDAFLEYLDSAGVAYEVHAHQPVGGAEHSAATTASPPERMVKTLAFKLPGQRWVLAALRAFDRLAYGELAKFCDVRRAELRAADQAAIERELGFQIGGVGPTALADNVMIAFDAAVLDIGIIYCGYGRADRTLAIDARALCEVVNGRRGRFARPGQRSPGH